MYKLFFFFSSRRRHTRCSRDWSSDVCSSDLCREGHFAAWDGHVFFGVRTARDGFFLDALDAFRVRSSARLAVPVALSDEDVPAPLAAAYPGVAFARGFVHAVEGQRRQWRGGGGPTRAAGRRASGD